MVPRKRKLQYNLRKNMLYALSGRIGLSLGFFQLRFFLESAVEGTCDTIDVSSGFSLFASHASTGLSFNKFIVMLKGGWLLCISLFVLTRLFNENFLVLLRLPG